MSTVGSESKLQEAWRWLTDQEVGIIGIYGIGGVGKTTLLKQIYKKLLTTLPDDFDTVIWVTISQNMSMEKIQDDIWKRIGVFNVEWVDKSFQEKAKAIHDVLCDKNFVLLLDDLGQQLDLTEVRVPRPQQNNCKVIFTTRSKDVCSRMGAQATIPVEALEWEYAWELFKNKVGEHRFGDPRILVLAQTIARTCKGLPMLLCTVGRAMASKTTYDEWFYAIKGVQLQVAEDVGIGYVSTLLQLCFGCLDWKVRFCLVYYSLFPEDFTILKNELIDFWICQQLLGPYDIEENVLRLGYKTIDVLIGACLLEEEGDNYVKLLDLIRDFALRPINRYGSMYAVPPSSLAQNMEVGWILQMRNLIRNLAFYVEDNLFTFLFNHNPFIMVKDKFIAPLFGKLVGAHKIKTFDQFINGLTVLDLSNSGVEQIPREIAKLVSLEYLNLSRTWIDHLPIEIKMLVKLKCLNLEYDEHLRVIPKQLVSSLTSLQVLKLFRCGFSVEEIEDNILSVTHMDIDPIFYLEHLKVLSITITCTHTLHKFFSSTKSLNCTQSLSLEVFWGSKSLDISPIAAMKNLLTLEIHQVENLKELNALPHSLGLVSERSFEKLREITLEKCSSLLELTWVILVPNLTVFKIKNCEEIEEIISIRRMGEIHEKRQDLEPFGKLEILVVDSLPKLKSIYWKALPFQCLKKIEVTDCDLLKKLPLNSNSAKANEVIIEAEEDWWTDIEWDDDITRDTFVTCFKPVID